MKELASSLVSIDKSQDIKSLRLLIKQETALPVRRMDTFTLIALLAVYRAKGNLTLSKSCGLYSCADYFSSELMQSMLIDVKNKNAIKPLSFVASVGNAANYYLASAYSITGPNVFLGSSKDAMTKNQFLAQTDMDTEIVDQAIMLEWQEDAKKRQCKVKIIASDGFFSERGGK
ncbi:MAG: hypothetical protein ACTH3B_02670 [Pseudoalteromonas sp.]